jgi:hypothetical protein
MHTSRRQVFLVIAILWVAVVAGLVHCSDLQYPCAASQVRVAVSPNLATGVLSTDGGCTAASCVVTTDAGCAVWTVEWPWSSGMPNTGCTLMLDLPDGAVPITTFAQEDRRCTITPLLIEAGF